jgi:hypothetical protein
MSNEINYPAIIELSVEIEVYAKNLRAAAQRQDFVGMRTARGLLKTYIDALWGVS